MGHILGLITGKLESLADAHDNGTLLRKRKAISALLPYAVWQERDKEYPILDAFLLVLKITGSCRFWWRRVQPFMNKLLDVTSDVSLNRPLILATPCVTWGPRGFWKDRVRLWAAAVSTVPKEGEIAPIVVDALLQIASIEPLQRYIPADAWSWLTLRPSLPPICKGWAMGSGRCVVQAVRDLKDIEILKSYLLLIWSEWNDCPQFSSAAMQISICEDFSGIEMNSHRADLLQRLDHVLAQLDRGLEHLQQNNPELREFSLERMKRRYGKFKETLLEVDREALEVLSRALSRLTTLFELLTHVGTHRITFDVHVCAPSCLSIGGRLGCLILVSLHHLHIRVPAVHRYQIYLRFSHYFQAVAVPSNCPLGGPPRLITSI